MWRYGQNTGNMYRPDGTLAGTGYAGGHQGTHPEGINNHDMQNVKSVGPLPVGMYTFGTPIAHSQLGPFAIPLIPDDDNEMFGRGDFFEHGDTLAMNHSASDGCIIQSRSVRDECHASPDQRLQVFVEEV